MTVDTLRQKYPKFIYEKFEYEIIKNNLEIKFYYSIPPDHQFTHRLIYHNLKHLQAANINEQIVLSLGLAEAASYWKTTCSPKIEIQAGNLPDRPSTSKPQSKEDWWRKLFLNGFSQYFYENKINYIEPEFLNITFPSHQLIPPQTSTPDESILLPIGGGKDSTVTGELLKSRFPLHPIIVYPASPASERISQMLTSTHPIIVMRKFDPHMIEMNKTGYLNGHVPYSAIIAFIFLLAAQVDKHKYIVVSNERSSNEGNVKYLGRQVNHQYSKSSEFELDFNDYIKGIGLRHKYFSFLRPLYELQISGLFSKMPQYFDTFRSCNKGQKEDRWCGSCAKCLSIAMTLGSWTNENTIKKIFGGINPLKNPDNSQILKEMTDPKEVKPFECITTTEEAQICLEFIAQGQTPRVKEFLSRWGISHMPIKFEKILRDELHKS